jgi:hypothetical protein
VMSATLGLGVEAGLRKCMSAQRPGRAISYHGNVVFLSPKPNLGPDGDRDMGWTYAGDYGSCSTKARQGLGEVMRGSDLISGLKRGFKVTTDVALAKELGISHVALQNWKKRPRVTERQICGLVKKTSGAAAAIAESRAIRPIVEFFPIKATESPRSSKIELFSPSEQGRKHPYRDGLRKELEEHHGIYIFFDSRGQAIYAGKARRQKLWHELKNAFNRERKDLQKIRRVRQPSRRQAYRTSDEKVRQIREFTVPLYEIASYFSAYEVADNMISELEAMLVRSFPNDLLNKRMERFGQQRRVRSSR